MNRFMVIRTTLVMGALVLSAGCVQPVWVKDGATQQQFSADQFDCKQKAYTMVGGYNTVNNFGALAVHAPGFFNECMESKGYRQMSMAQVEAAQQEEAKRIRQSWSQPTDAEIQRREVGYVPPSQRTDQTEQEQATSRSSGSGRYGGY